MKKFTLLFLMCFVASFVLAETTFNWEETILSEGNNLQQVHKYDDNSIVVVGNSGTFMKYDPTSGEWSKVGVLTPTYDFIDMSIKGSKGIMSSRRTKLINNPSGGNFDIYENGMLLKTEDDGASWTHVDVSALANMAHDSINPLDAGSMAMDIFACEYIDDDNMLIYSGWYDYRSGDKVSRGAVFTTTDGGTTWSNLTGDLGSSIVNTLYNWGPNNYFGGLNMLYKNETGTTNVTDLYDAFTASAGDDSFYVSDITFAGPTTFYVVTTSDGIHVTTDDGATFTQLGGTAPTGGNDFYYHNANVMMSLGSSSKSKATADGGTTWVDVYPGTSCWEIAGVFNDSLVALAKTSIFKMAVTDLEAGNFNWVSSAVSDNQNLQKLHIVDNSNAFICGYGGTMKITSDAGLNWVDVDAPEPILPIAEEIDFNTLSVADGLSVSSARRFKLIDYPSGSEYEDMSVDGLVYISDDNWETWEIYDITDVGETTSEDVSLNPECDNCYGTDPYTLTITNDSTIYVWVNWYAVEDEQLKATKTTHSRVFKSTNSGETWTSISRDFGSSFITDINFIDEDNGYIAGNTVLMKTNDAGATFTDLYPSLVVDPQDDSTYYLKGVTAIDMDEIYVTTVSNGVFKSTDAGANFTIFEGISGGNDFFKIDDYAYMVLGTSTKSNYTKDGGTTWENCYPGSSIWTIGGVINDSIWALAKGKIFKIAYDEVIYNVGIGEYNPDVSELEVKYAYNSIELTSNEEIEECTVYSITGEVVARYTPYAQKCVIETNTFSSGVYVATSKVGGKMYINKLWIVK